MEREWELLGKMGGLVLLAAYIYKATLICKNIRFSTHGETTTEDGRKSRRENTVGKLQLSIFEVPVLFRGT